MKHNFKGSMLLAISLIQCSMGMRALDGMMTCDAGKARAFIGNNTWVSGNPDKMATLVKDAQEIRTKTIGIPEDAPSSVSSVLPMLGVNVGLCIVEYLASSASVYYILGPLFNLSENIQDWLPIIITIPLHIGVSIGLEKYATNIDKKHEQRYQEAVAQRAKNLGLEVYTEKAADKIK